MSMVDIDVRFRAAIQSYWQKRREAKEEQASRGKLDAGTRSEVTSGTQMGALEVLVTDLLEESGLARSDMEKSTGLQLPGYYRPEKRWDLLVVSREQLVTAIEFKSHVGPSFGNNVNNRIEEAIGSASDIWTAWRERRLGAGPRPFLGYFLLLEDVPKVHEPTRKWEPHFSIDPVFSSDAQPGRAISYAQRYEVFCRRLLLERLYDAVCFTLATNEDEPRITHPSEDLSFRRFVAELQGNAQRFLATRSM